MPTPANPHLFERGRMICLALTLLGAILCLLAWPMNREQFYFSWLSSWSFAWTTLMGVLFFVLLHHLVDAAWSTVVRRPAEQLLACTPIILLLLIPILVGAFSGHIYHWITIDPHHDELLEKKSWWLNIPFFALRLVIYALLWTALSFLLRRNSLKQDLDGAAHWTISNRRYSALGILAYALTLSACAFDLLMALDYHWFSTVFAVYVWTGGVVSGLCVISLITLAMIRGPLKPYIGLDHLHDLGKLIFAFSIFWGYISFSQYFLIWYGNIPEETTYYLRRWYGTAQQDSSWWIVSILLATGRFLIPFFFMMSAHMKRHPRTLGAFSVILLFSHWVDQYWMVHPEHTPAAPPLQWIWIDLAALSLIIGLCGLLYIPLLRRASLVPINDPRLEESLPGEHAQLESIDND